jgi:hypothetical protein
MAMYESLDIRKERIDPRQSWQHYREAHFGIMRRLADYSLNTAPMLNEMKKAHRNSFETTTSIFILRIVNVRTGGTVPRVCYVAYWRVLF